MRRVVTDTGPVLHLTEAGELSLLELAGDIHVPPAVDAELARYVPDWLNQRPVWMIAGVLDPVHVQQADAWQRAGLLQTGEAEAIALARLILGGVRLPRAHC